MLALCALLILAPALSMAQADGSAEERVKQAKDLAKQGSEAVARLSVLVKDPAVEVRREAAKSLASIGTQYTLEPLTAALADADDEVRIRATDGIVGFYRPGHLDTSISNYLKRGGDGLSARWRRDVYEEAIDPDVFVRPEIVEALGKLVVEPNSLLVRANAARAIGILRGRAALPGVIESLRSKDDRLIFESLIAIQKLRDPEAGPRVIFLLRDLDEKIQRTAVETVGLLRTKDAVDALRRVYDEDPSKKVRRAAMIALGRIAAPASHEMFLQALQDKDEEIRAGAAEGLGRLQRASDREPVAAVYKTESKPSARLAEAFALVSLGDTEIAEFSPLRDLVNHLNSRAWRGVAQPYLSELFMDEAARKAAYALIPSGTKEEKNALAMALAASGAADAVAPLEQLMRDPDPEVGNTAVRAVRILRSSLR